MRRLTREVPRWDVYLHREARDLPPASDFDPSRMQLEDELFSMLYSGETEPLTGAARHRSHREWAEAVHAQLAQLPQFERLRTECSGDAVAAATAVEHLLAGVGNPEETSDEHGQRRALRRACVTASQNVDEVKEALSAFQHVTFSAGQEVGGVNKQTSSSALELARELRTKPRLRELARVAGRVRQVAATWRRKRMQRAAEEVADIELGGDLARLLPAGLVQLSHPLLRRLMLTAVVEGTAMQYALSGSDAVGRGPLVVCIDKSGSMDGERDQWATAVALALLDAAKEDGRAFALIAFDAAIRREDVVSIGGELPLDALFTGCDGGTNIEEAIDRALSVIERESTMRRADIVLVTDGISEAARSVELRRRAQARGVDVVGVAIGVDASSLRPWCSAVTTATNLASLDSATASLLFAA